MDISLDALKRIMPSATYGDISRVLAPLNLTLTECDLTGLRAAAFIATIAHETGSLRRYVENLNYSAEGLCGTWPKRFRKPGYSEPEDAREFSDGRANALFYARKPEMIANRVYANRMGNGDEASGDGWAHRGAGAIQITGKDNQSAVAEHFGKPLYDVVEWMQTPEGAVRSAGFYWTTNNLNALADIGDFAGVSAFVNTGNRHTPTNKILGWSERMKFYDTAREVLA